MSDESDWRRGEQKDVEECALIWQQIGGVAIGNHGARAVRWRLNSRGPGKVKPQYGSRAGLYRTRCSKR